jgi:NAD(P)-dependent dehydrogenase (short-subunit alcohol dehydrogenase family)
MTSSNSSRIVIGASSDIGYALSSHWLSLGHKVVGTYRVHSEQINQLEAAGGELFECDFSVDSSVDTAAKQILASIENWEVLSLLPGTMMPIQPFEECDFNQWVDSFQVNFLNQIRMLHGLLPGRSNSTEHGALILLCAGGGSNSAPKNLSAYTASKIALTKMCELLDAEISDIRSVIVGPGWVKTRIHQEMISAGDLAGEAYHRTLERFDADNFVPMAQVLACIDWLNSQPREIVGGRNFSVPHDLWGSQAMIDKLNSNINMYKLRRHFNEWKP